MRHNRMGNRRVLLGFVLVMSMGTPAAGAAPPGQSFPDTCVEPPPPAWQAQPLTELVSVGPSGQGTGSSGQPAISADGRYVAFRATSKLTADDATNSPDIYVRDRLAFCGPRTILVSVASDGSQAGSFATDPSISADGRFVAFASGGALVPEDDNETNDVYVHDRDADEDGTFDEPGAISTVRASVGPAGSGGGSPHLSADGGFVAFSTDEPLVAEDQNSDYDAYVHDLSTGTTHLVSVALAGGAAGGFSRAESISADGRYVSFRSDADDIISAGLDTNGGNDVFVRDLLTQTTERVSVGQAGEGNAWSAGSSLSADGRRVAFTSVATNLVSPPTTTSNVYLRDLDAQTTELVSVTPDSTEPNGSSTGARISGDGSRVVFESEATDLVPFDFFPITDVFVRDLDDQLTMRVSVSTTGGNANGNSGPAAVTADGSRVVFASSASNIVAPDDNGDTSDVFLRTIPTELEPRMAPKKSGRIGEGDPRRAVLKLVQGSDVRLDRGRFVSKRYDLRGVNETVARYEVRPERLVKLPEERVTALVRNAEALTGREHADFNLYYELHLPRGADSGELLRALNEESVVELAEPGGMPVPASHEPTPWFIHEQGYRKAAPGGLDSMFANSLGGDGTGVGLVDIEMGWNLDHEELDLPQSTILQTGGDAPIPVHEDHGTAVLGVIVGKEGGPGITGMAPDTTVHVATRPVANAVLWAADHLLLDNLPADVILVEVAYKASMDGEADLPVEIHQEEYDAIALAVANGVTVVEAAGNVGTDLDQYWDDTSQSYVLRRSVRDSGAIFVGAGCPPSVHLPQNYGPCQDLTAIDRPAWGSNHGSRLDVQGYGTGVRTLGSATPEPPCAQGVQCGFGKDAHADEPDRYYTGDFGGTSSASAVVAGAVAAAQGAHVAANGAALDPLSLRSLLVTTGTPQPSADASVRPIGPRPDLGEALAAFMPWWWTWIDVPVEQCVGPCGCPECFRTGDEITWLINVARFGPDPIDRAQIVDTLPDRIAFSGVEVPDGWSCRTPPAGASGEISCWTDGVPGSEQIRITGDVMRDARGSLHNLVRSTAWSGELTRIYELTSEVLIES